MLAVTEGKGVLQGQAVTQIATTSESSQDGKPLPSTLDTSRESTSSCNKESQPTPADHQKSLTTKAENEEDGKTSTADAPLTLPADGRVEKSGNADNEVNGLREPLPRSSAFKAGRSDSSVDARQCADCQTSSTPQWRKGPGGRYTMCNRCGIAWAKNNFREIARPSEQRLSRASEQVELIGEYTLLVEDRIQALEAEVDRLKGEVPNRPDTPVKPDAPHMGETVQDSLEFLEIFKPVLEIRRGGESEYVRPHKDRLEKRFLIDVWMADVGGKIPATRMYSMPKLPNTDADIGDSADKVHPIAATSTSHMEAANSQQPRRIRVRSRRLLRELSKLTGQSFGGPLQRQSQFLPPFEIFTKYEADIRGHLRKLEDTCGLTSSQGGKRKDAHGKPMEKPVGSIIGNSKLSKTHFRDGHDESFIRQCGNLILEIVETCQVNCSHAVNVLKEETDVSNTIEMLRKEMTEAEQEHARREDMKLLVREWRVLLRLLDVDLKPLFDFRARLNRSSITSIAFSDLSHLFRPGMTVIYNSKTQPQALSVVATCGGREKLAVDDEDEEDGSYSAYNPFVVDCFYCDFDGECFGCVPKSFTITKYQGTKTIDTLPVFPEAFIDSNSDPRSKLLSRGRGFVELCNGTPVHHRQYTGRTLDINPMQVDSEVIVDCQMAALVQPEYRPDAGEWMPTLGVNQACEPDAREVTDGDIRRRCEISNCFVCPGFNDIFDDHVFNRKAVNEYTAQLGFRGREITVQDIKPEETILLPPRIFGFILRNRKWARLEVPTLEPISSEGNGFEKLVLKRGYSELVRALVMTHARVTNPKDEPSRLRREVDLVKGKGRGLIILLHGAPGVGKTSTAESVAEFTKKPLFPITCGDIGETARDVEENLDRCFQMANKWGCVLLLDEADVFLAQRNKNDLKRNALVSVFLRVLEYYAGILFLTTNRVGAFDDAFKSRIHMSLFYPDLGRDPTRKVWEMNLARIRENNKDIEINDDGILDFAMKHYDKTEKTGKWNGRQIRNAFQTAIALAEWEAKGNNADGSTPQPVKLTKSHFKKVAKASRGFNKYLRETHGKYEEERAQDNSERAANWQLEASSKRKKSGKSKSSRRNMSSSDSSEEEKPKKSKSKKRPKSEDEEDTSDSEDD